MREGRESLSLVRCPKIVVPSLEEGHAAGVQAGRLIRTLVHDVQAPGIYDVTWLGDCSWPGNVRELHNAIERAVLVRSGAGLLNPDDLLAEGGAAAWVKPDEAGGTPHDVPFRELSRAQKRQGVRAAVNEVRQRPPRCRGVGHQSPDRLQLPR